MVGQNILESQAFEKYELLAPTRKELDLFNYQAVQNFISNLRPEIIIHAAGRVGGIQANMANPVEFLVENLDINRNVIMAARKSGVKKLINLGSSCMYPRNAPNPLTEDLVLKGELEPTNEGYALAKIMAQRLCSYIHKEDKSFQYKTLLPCNLYGRFDKFDPSHSHLVPAVIRKLHDAKIGGVKEVDIWGDGTARREFMYAGDLADFLALAVQRFDSVPELINVGVGLDHSINAYYEAAAEVIGYSGKFKHDLTKPVGMKQKLTSVKLAHDWGWKSQTTLVDGISKAYQYFLNLKN